MNIFSYFGRRSRLDIFLKVSSPLDIIISLYLLTFDFDGIAQSDPLFVRELHIYYLHDFADLSVRGRNMIYPEVVMY